ncbi:hypothetical protein DL93DRAFT_2080334 [Clavulina sp. PMI_390]|nr:hypothetical protein DL93DRAFT_2080334 [Clavulina sp. PMI_390]
MTLRSIVLYTAALITASLFRSRALGLSLNILIAARLGTTAFSIQAVYNSFRSIPHPKKDTLPRLLAANNIISLGAECVVCTLLCTAVARAKLRGSHDSRIDRTTRYAIPAYIVTVVWQIVFSLSIWLRSPFATACVGIPMGAISNITLLAMLHADPSALGLPLWRHLDTINTILSPTKIAVCHDVSTQSCHDGPLEHNLMERLGRMFPEEEESRTYHPEPEEPDPVARRACGVERVRSDLRTIS